MGRLLIILLLFPILELALMIRVHRYWSSLWGSGEAWLLTFAALTLAAFGGTRIAKRFGIRALREAQVQLSQGQIPSRKLLRGLMSLGAGILLVIPGYLSDGLGILLLLPAIDRPIAFLMSRWLERKVRRGEFHMHRSQAKREPAPAERAQSAQIIDVEVIAEK